MDSTAGFVLTGGRRSSRIAREKALLRIEAFLFIERTAQRVSGIDLLCAVYQRCTADAVHFTIKPKRLKMHDLLKSLGATSWPVANVSLLETMDTPFALGAR